MAQQAKVSKPKNLFDSRGPMWLVGGENEPIMLGTWPMTCTCVSRHLLEQEHTHKTNKSVRKALRVK